MRVDPRCLVHAHDRADEHVTRRREDHHERVQLPVPTRRRVEPHPEIAVIDLHLGAGLNLGAQHRGIIGGDFVRELHPHIPAETRQPDRQTVFVAQALPHRRRPVRCEHRHDQIAMHVDLTEGQTPCFRVDQLREPAGRQHRPLRTCHRRAARCHARFNGRRHVLADRAPIDPQTLRDVGLRPPRVPVLAHLNNVDHVEQSPCHLNSSPIGIDERGLTEPRSRNRRCPGEPAGDYVNRPRWIT